LSLLGKHGVKVIPRTIHYTEKTISIPDYGEYNVKVGHEKGIDIRIALDAIRLFRENKVDVVLFFSQDQDFTEVVKELNSFAQKDNKWIKIACAFLDNPSVGKCRGINKTNWIRISREFYDSCIDPIDYRKYFGK